MCETRAGCHRYHRVMAGGRSPWAPHQHDTWGVCVWGGGGGRDALEGKGPQRRPQRQLDRRLEEVARAVGGGYCRLQMPLKLAQGVRGTVAGHRLRAPEGWGGTSPPFQCIPGGGASWGWGSGVWTRSAPVVSGIARANPHAPAVPRVPRVRARGLVYCFGRCLFVGVPLREGGRGGERRGGRKKGGWLPPPPPPAPLQREAYGIGVVHLDGTTGLLCEGGGGVYRGGGGGTVVKGLGEGVGSLGPPRPPSVWDQCQA